MVEVQFQPFHCPGQPFPYGPVNAPPLGSLPGGRAGFGIGSSNAPETAVASASETGRDGITKVPCLPGPSVGITSKPGPRVLILPTLLTRILGWGKSPSRARSRGVMPDAVWTDKPQ